MAETKIDYLKLGALLLCGILIGVLISVLFSKKGSADKIVIELKYDSIPKTINTSTIEKPVIIKSGDIDLPQSVINVWSNPQLDTAFIKQVYKELALKHYAEYVQHTQSADSNIIVDTWDTISENSLKGRKLQYKWLKPDTNRTVYLTKAKVYAGLSLEAGQTGVNYFGPDLYYTSKKGTLISVGYNTYNLISGEDKYSFRLGVAQKISFQK